MKPFTSLACFLLMIAAARASCVAPAAAPVPETVVLLHGLGRTQISMLPLAWALEREGYHVVNLSYPWRTRSLEELASTWLPERLATLAPQTARVHLVTHSMGGILVRLWLREKTPPRNLGRVVMLAPPNRGSELADRLQVSAAYRVLTGPNGSRLGTAGAALPSTLGSWPRTAPALGIIAGSSHLNPLLGRHLPAPHDGKVTVASTHLDGEADHRVLAVSHTWLPCRRAVQREVAAFLRTGRFTPQP